MLPAYYVNFVENDVPITNVNDKLKDTCEITVKKNYDPD